MNSVDEQTVESLLDEKLSNMDCNDFVPWILEGTEITLVNGGQRFSLRLYTVLGQGTDMVALFRGDRKARLSVRLLGLKNPVFKGIIDEIHESKNKDDEWGFEEPLVTDESLGEGGGDAVGDMA